MPATVEQGTIIFREWHRVEGLREARRAFASLDELFETCLAVSDPQMVDRILLRGNDGEGRPHTITFTFQALTQSQRLNQPVPGVD